MSQRKRVDEQILERLENALAHQGHIRKVLEIVVHKVDRTISNETVRGTTLADLQEIRDQAQKTQAEIADLIRQLGL